MTYILSYCMWNSKYTNLNARNHLAFMNGTIFRVKLTLGMAVQKARHLMTLSNCLCCPLSHSSSGMLVWAYPIILICFPGSVSFYLNKTMLSLKVGGFQCLWLAAYPWFLHSVYHPNSCCVFMLFIYFGLLSVSDFWFRNLLIHNYHFIATGIIVNQHQFIIVIVQLLSKSTWWLA